MTDEPSTDQEHQHTRALAEIRRAFHAGEISVATKRRYIAEENMAYYRDSNLRSAATGALLCQVPRVPDQAARDIAESTGMDYETVRAALEQRRALYRAAANADHRQGDLMELATRTYHSQTTPKGKHAQ